MSRKDKCTYPAVALGLITNHLASMAMGGKVTQAWVRHPRNMWVSAGHPHNTHCRVDECSGVQLSEGSRNGSK